MSEVIVVISMHCWFVQSGVTVTGVVSPNA